ncbi:MAG TPA: uracil-DNA glycosylase family protein [Sphingobium sp.]
MAWWARAGVDHAVSEMPMNWLRPVVAPATPRPDREHPQPRALPDTLDSFHLWLANDDMVHEGGWSTHRILPTGVRDAALMVICDLPDPGDAEAGALLSGEAGQLFDAMLAAIGLARPQIYLASLSVTRAPGGLLHDRDMETLAARMRHQIGLAAPRRILLLGDKTNRALLAAGLPSRPAGLQTVNHPGGTVPAIASRHPRSLLRFPEEKANSWRALQYLIEDLPS